MRGITSPEYFATLGIPLLAGRNFTEDEMAQQRPVIIANQTLAKRLWPDQDPLGKTIRTVARPGADPWQLTVIGVAGNTHQVSLESGTRPEVIRPRLDYTSW